jgi:3'(2'), 5'-bisphosphate nucleotidase
MTGSRGLIDEAVQARVVDMVQELGRRLLDWRSDKGMREFVKEEEHKLAADIAADDFLRRNLTHLTPGIPVVSEEDATRSLERPPLYWLLDPIDGTASWRGGFAGFVTQLALISQEEPWFSVVHAPVLGKTYVAGPAGSGTLNGIPLVARKGRQPLVITDNTPQPHGICLPVMRALGTDGYHESGSLGLKICLVADGTADLFVKDVVVRDWDVAPGIAVLRAVGGILTRADGRAFQLAGGYDKLEGLLVARDRDLWRRAGLAMAQAKGWRFQG